MGKLVEGVWRDEWYDTEKSGGRFVREDSSFRGWVSADGSTGHEAESGRYHLYVSLACPWAHRTLIFRKLKGLEEVISLSVVHWHMAENGWTFQPGEGVVADPIHNADYLHQIYTAARRDYSGRVTVPVLWDKKAETIVNNESSEIIRMLNREFDSFAGDEDDYCPETLREEIDRINEFVYHNINNGVYKCGFATSQSAYEGAFDKLFTALDEIEKRLSTQRYLAGEVVTEADWRLFTTMVRFDPVYVGHFKCNLRRLVDYPNLWNYVRELHQVPGVADTVNLFHIKHHYYGSHVTVNPTGIVPRGPDIDYTTPHDRDRLSA